MGGLIGVSRGGIVGGRRRSGRRGLLKAEGVTVLRVMWGMARVAMVRGERVGVVLTGLVGFSERGGGV